MIGYRNFSIFQEEAAFNIFIDCIRACDPLELEVIGTFTPRGAMTTIAHFVYNRLSEEGLTQQTKQNALNEN